jgi:hypothetical protein
MKKYLTSCAVLAALPVLLMACAVALGPDGAQLGRSPAAVQGSNDAQGAPLSVPGAGMGVGSGNPSPAGMTVPVPGR